MIFFISKKETWMLNAYNFLRVQHRTTFYISRYYHYHSPLYTNVIVNQLPQSNWPSAPLLIVFLILTDMQGKFSFVEIYSWNPGLHFIVYMPTVLTSTVARWSHRLPQIPSHYPPF